MLKLEGVSKYYFTGNQIVQALRRVTLECHVGEFIAVTGESGSGKSTLLNVMSGLDTYEEGVVYFDGKDLSHYTLDELEVYRKDSIGYVFQEFNIIESYTVYENVDLALRIQGYPREERRRRALELIERVGLTDKMRQKASRLSGGEKQRTVIARTLAKDYRVLMCDEPTGNLNEAAARGIFELLRSIAKDKLVVVVTHDVRLADEYATRKIRLYDGDVVEDAVLVPPSAIPAPSPALPPTRFRGSAAVGLQNVATSPKRTFFTILTAFFLFVSALFVYGAGIVQANRPIDVENPYFTNASPTRIVVTKDDGTVFSDADLALIAGLPDVRAAFPDDLVFDSVFTTRIYDEEELVSVFYDFEPLPAAALDEGDLSAGRLPEAADEVVVAADGPFLLGDDVPVANDYLLLPISTIETDQFVFTVVGLIDVDSDPHPLYLHADGFALLSPSSVFERSEVEFRFSGTSRFDMPSDAWVVDPSAPGYEAKNRTYDLNFPIWIDRDDVLADGEILVFDMFFWDICRDFGYKREINDDFDAGLCDADAFIASHEIALRVNSPYDDERDWEDVVLLSAPATDDDQSQKLYMNEATYMRYFGESGHQATAVVKSAFEGVKVVRALEKAGFATLYPARILNDAQSLQVLLANLIVIAVVAAILFVVFFVVRFVVQSLVLSRQKDYLIMRSIGASPRGIAGVLRAELFAIALFAAGLAAAVLAIVSRETDAFADILGHLLWHDYLAVAAVVLLMLERMVESIRRRVFAANVIAALKGAER